MIRKNDQNQFDNELADFADRVLSGGGDQFASTADDELLSLEKTILRLSNAFPPETLEETISRQMLGRLKARVRREEEQAAAKPSFWKRLFDLQSNSQVGILVAVMAVVVLAVVILPDFQSPGSSMTGTAFSGSNLLPILGVIAVLSVLYWISRRK